MVGLKPISIVKTFLHEIAVNEREGINGPSLTSESPPKPPSIKDCESKLNGLEWDETDRLYEIALAIFYDLNDHEKEVVEFLCLSTLNEQFKDMKSTIMVASMVDEVVEVVEWNEQIEAKEISYTGDEDGSTHDSTVLPLSFPPPPHFPIG
ncbi:hypothetical protein Tco_1041731 [Tanacetum coccineum]|uniref:Uncharacterized protein n=1 Tax=Tanacetum coccineum TaxID=301880 RepID=A0ABQ5GHI7_9ASTR